MKENTQNIHHYILSSATEKPMTSYTNNANFTLNKPIACHHALSLPSNPGVSLSCKAKLVIDDYSTGHFTLM